MYILSVSYVRFLIFQAHYGRNQIKQWPSLQHTYNLISDFISRCVRNARVLLCRLTPVYYSGSQTVRRDPLGRRGLTPAEASRTGNTETRKKKLEIKICFVRSSVAVIKSEYRSEINVEKGLYVAVSECYQYLRYYVKANTPVPLND
jgi:hypothetical protein